MRDQIVTNLLSWLDKRDKLALRATCKSWRELVRNHQDGPYQNKIEFILGASCLFNDWSHLQTAWLVYKNNINSYKRKPAMLYKLKDLQQYLKDGTIDQLLKKDSARVYGPGRFHTWPVNRSWLLSQIHFARPFTVYSDIDDVTIMRQDKPLMFSSFAKEISVAIKAGFSVSINKDNRIQLNPNNHPEAKFFNPVNIDVTDDEVREAMNIVKPYQHHLNMVRHIKYALNEFINHLKTKSTEELDDARLQIDSLVSNLLDDYFAKSNNKKLTLNLLINNLKENCSMLSRSTPTYSSNLFFEGVELERIKKIISTWLNNEINYHLSRYPSLCKN